MFARPKKVLFVLIVIGLLTCGFGCQHSSPIDTGADADADADADSDSDSDSDTDTDTDTDTGTDTGTDDICNGMEEETYVVPSPDDGIAATQAAICAASDPTAVSNKAATVALAVDPTNYIHASGSVALAADLVGKVVGLPTIEISEAVPTDIAGAVISGIATAADGFTFDALFSSGSPYPGETEITIKVTMEISCDDSSGDTQLVSSITYLHLCDASESLWTWVSSGGECTVCTEVCEKIACPLPARRGGGFSTLAGSPRAEIVPVALHGRRVVLFAEHRGTEGPLAYSWKVSGGAITGQGEAGIIWELPAEPGPHLVQVAVKDATSATVAALRWRTRS